MSTAPVRGVVSVVDDEGCLSGLFTDGDFRLLMHKRNDPATVLASPLTDVMTRQPTTIAAEVLAAEALRIMEEREFDNLPVVDANGKAVGMVDIQDLLKLRVI